MRFNHKRIDLMKVALAVDAAAFIRLSLSLSLSIELARRSTSRNIHWSDASANIAVPVPSHALAEGASFNLCRSGDSECQMARPPCVQVLARARARPLRRPS